MEISTDTKLPARNHGKLYTWCMDLLFKGWKSHVDLLPAKGTKRTLYRNKAKGPAWTKGMKWRWLKTGDNLRSKIPSYAINLYIYREREGETFSPVVALLPFSESSELLRKLETPLASSLKSLTPPTEVLPSCSTTAPPLTASPSTASNRFVYERNLETPNDSETSPPASYSLHDRWSPGIVGHLPVMEFIWLETKWNNLFLMTLFQKELVHNTIPT